MLAFQQGRGEELSRSRPVYQCPVLFTGSESSRYCKKIQNTGQAREREKDAWEQTQVPHKSQSNTQYTPRRVHPKRTCILDLWGTAQRTTGNPCTAFIPVSIPEALGTCAQTTCAARTPPWISPKTPTSTNTHVQKQPFYMCVTNDLPKMSQSRPEERALALDD